MLTEIALTPHALDPCPHNRPGWAAGTKALLRRLTELRKYNPVIFSDLYHGVPEAAWLGAVRRQVAGLPAEVRIDLINLLDRIEPGLVARPAQRANRRPEAEAHWVEEACGPAAVHRPATLVSSHLGLSPARQRFGRTARSITALDADTEFWADVHESVEVPMAADAQIAALRPVWLHASHLAVVLPHALKGGEGDWFLALAAAAWGRPAGHGRPVIELHVNADGASARDLVQPRGLLTLFKQKAERSLPAGCRPSVVVRKDVGRLVERRVFTWRSVVRGGQEAEAPQWGVFLGHVAFPGDARQVGSGTKFGLLTRETTGREFAGECRQAARLVDRYLIGG